MSDFIFIEALQVDAIIGCLAHERNARQPIFLDVKLFFDLDASMRSDDLNDTINYADVVDRLTEYLASTQFQLIEMLAESISQWLFGHYPIKKVQLTLRKPQAISQAKTVGISIERERDALTVS